VASDGADEARLRYLGARLREDAGGMAQKLSARIAEEAPEWLTDHPEVARRGYRMTRSSLESQFAALAEGGEIPDELPPPDAEFARLAAQLDVPLRLVLDLYHRALPVVWDAWFELIGSVEPDPAKQQRLLQSGSQFFMTYGPWLLKAVVEEYEREREAVRRSGEGRRLHLVREVLAGKDLDTGALGYELAGHHVGLVLWGERARAAADALAGELGRRLLYVEVAEHTSWAWLGGPRALSAERRARLAGFQPPDGTRLAIGAEGAGADGFRQTHADAVAAHRAAFAGDRPATTFDDVALEALAARDEAAARRFVARELRGIDGDDARSERLRETLSAYFAHGSNAAATAKALDIHEQTVAQRLTAVEERTGRAIVNRRAELDTALRLRRYFTTQPPA
jgi:hypothetical protein